MTHRNRWFTVLKNGWIFPWLCKRLPEGTYTYSASSITGNSARSSECQANLIFRGSSFCQVKVYIPKTAPTSRYLNDLLYTPSCCWYHIPSGKLTSLWKITTFNGKTHYKLPFSIAMLVYQRVYSHQNIPFCWDPQYWQLWIKKQIYVCPNFPSAQTCPFGHSHWSLCLHYLLVNPCKTSMFDGSTQLFCHGQTDISEV